MPRFHHASAYVQQVRPRSLRALGATPLITALAAMLTLSSGTALSWREAVFRGVLGAMGPLAQRSS